MLNQHTDSPGPIQAGQATVMMAQHGDTQATEFSAAQMQAFIALPYKRPETERLLRERGDFTDPFQAHLLRLSYEKSVVYSAIMVEFAGSPLWVEFKHKNSARWAFVLPDLYEDGRFRVQFFDEDGMIRHHGANSLQEAVETMVSEGFQTSDRGRLDVLSPTNRWKRGTELAGLIMKLNTRQITHEQFGDLQKAIIEQYPC